MKENKKLLLIMTDLDGTLFPTSSKNILKLVDTLKEIENRTGSIVKFCPISGRTSSYVLSTMDRMEKDFEVAGLKNGLGYGAAELGSIIIFGKDEPFKRNILYSGNKSQIINKMRKDVLEGEYSNFFETDPDAHFVTAFVLKKKFIEEIENETKKEDVGETLSNEEIKAVNESKRKNRYYKPLRKYLEEKYDKDLDIVYSDAIEVKPPEISKENAIKWIVNKYMTGKEYEGTQIVGLIYCGDSENDKNAVDYVSKLASIPALMPDVKINVFLPSNATNEIKSENIEQWKDKFEKFGLKKCVKISKYLRCEGITDLLKIHLEKGELIGELTEKKEFPKEIKDDFGVNYGRKLCNYGKII